MRRWLPDSPCLRLTLDETYMTTNNEDVDTRADAMGESTDSRTAPADRGVVSNDDALCPPWTMKCEQYGTFVFDADGNSVASVFGGRVDLLPADTQQALMRLADHREARATLIAAAPDLLASLKEMRAAVAAAMRVVADLDAAHLIGADSDTRQQRFIDELHLVGVTDGFGTRADAAIKKAEGR